MAGVVRIQVHVVVKYDDDTAMSMSSPEYAKDIRDGDFFTDEQVIDACEQALAGVASVIRENTLFKLYLATKKNDEEPPKPRWDWPFSDN